MKNHNRQMNSQFITPVYVWGLCGLFSLFNQGDVDIKTT